MDRGNTLILRICGAMGGAAVAAALVLAALTLFPDLRADVARGALFAAGLIGALLGALWLPGWIRAALLLLAP